MTVTPRPAPGTRHSFAACHATTAAANSSFPVAFRLLAPARRRAMDALYAYMRVTDDLADEPGEPGQKRAKLAAWRASLSAALAGAFTHPIHPALADTVRRFDVPERFLFDAIDGMETDVGPVRMATFDELYPYCYRVASAVGLACVRIWGARPGVTADDTDPPAEAAGIAFQLTNVLRDLGEDLARDRVYLPADELAHFDCPPERWRDPAFADRFRAMMRFQVARARDYYRRGAELAPLLSPDGRAIFHVMRGAYSRLLDEIERAGYDVFARRVRVPKWRKAAVCAAGWLVKWGLW
ncbi:MAG: phytoene/squalene synthase family protein [Planctomycetes bacterium]|nr:phytoene/squalene synthase family protein [Planctomycetota bacterium]